VFFGDQNPVGQTMRLVFSSNKDKGTEWEIVGVTGSLPKTATELESDPAMYIPHQKSFWPIGEFVVKGSLPPPQLYSAIRQAVARVDRQQVVENLRTLDKVLDEQVAQPRLNAWLVGVFATAALVLAAMGIYGLLSNTVMHRAQEIGIRMALGARQSSIVALVIWQVLPLLATGLTLGLAAAWFLKGLLGKLLFGLKPTDPLSLVGSTGLLLVAALAACYIPARRASRLDPIRVLRNE
jgi:predicted lysophospholipase L1 biosynthesis ABC-type transport system permease subunit